jgi:hypothetical protein
MRLCDYFLKADRKLDLSSPEAGRKWLESVPLGAFALSDEPESWTERAQRDWQRNVLALRSIAKRLKQKSRRGTDRQRSQWIKEDAVAFYYVAMMYPHSWAADVLFKGCLPQHEILPSGPRERKCGSDFNYFLSREDWTGPGNQEDEWGVFWQKVFYSLLFNRGGICEWCFKELPAKTRRRRYHKKCYYEKWYREQKKDPEKTEAMREKWAADKKRQRTQKPHQ